SIIGLGRWRCWAVYIDALGTQAGTVPEPISNGDGPLLFLNLSFLVVPLFAFSRVSFWLLESLHSSSYFLFIFSSLFHRCSDSFSLLSSFSRWALIFPYLSPASPDLQPTKTSTNTGARSLLPATPGIHCHYY